LAGNGDGEGETAEEFASATTVDGSLIRGEGFEPEGEAGSAGSSSESDSFNHCPIDFFSACRKPAAVDDR
jgi:hypothetical protein